MKKFSLHRVILNLTAVMNMVIFFFCCSGSKQIIVKEENKEVNYIPYYLKVYEADSLYLTGNYERSFEILDSLSSKYELLNQITIRDIELYIKTAYLTGNYEVLKTAIKSLVSIWDYKPEYIEYDSLMAEAWKKANLTEEEILKWKQTCKNNINWTLRDTLITMTKNDQKYRKDSGVDLVRDSVDRAHKNLLKYIFNKYGYPDFRMIGSPRAEENVDLRVVYLHIFNQLDENEYTYFQDKLLEYIKEGTASPRYLANLIDRTNFTYKHTTVYGTYGTHESWGGKMVNFDTIEVNKNRKLIGLPSIEYQQFKWNIHELMFNQ